MIASLVISYLLGGAELTYTRMEFSSMASCQEAAQEVLFIKQKDASLSVSCRSQVGTEEKRKPKGFKYSLNATFFNGYRIENQIKFKVYDNLKDCEKYMTDLSSTLENISNNPSVSYCLPEEF
jgi:hypothetical protein